MPNNAVIPKVLIVNDDASALLALSAVLTEVSGTPKYEVISVQSGEEALRQVLKHNFAVILLDVSMPIMDGFQTAEAIHSHPRSASIPIIFITAHYGDELNKLKGYQKGAADYLFAPVIPSIMQAKVAVFVELNQKNLQLESKTLELEDLNRDLRVQRMHDLERVNAALEKEIIERRFAEQRAIDLASHDSLTGLLNRRSLIEQLRHAITQAARRKERLALMFLDLDKFKEINDTLGHEAGDELLKQFAIHLDSAVRESDTVARLGGDEFVIILEGFPDSSDVELIARKITQINNEPHIVGGHQIKTSTSIGICFYPEDGATAEALLKNADAAMYHAKQKERGSVQLFRKEFNASEDQHNVFKQEILHALEFNEFELYYQPKIDILSGKATGIEALLYWNHPRLGLLAYTEFVSHIIQSGQSFRISEWIVFVVCAQARSWQNATVPFTLPIAINIDIAQLQPELSKTILTALGTYGVAPHHLQIEVSESALIRDIANASSLLSDVSGAGIGITLDGFGAEFSSLTALKNLPITMLKIDPCFLQNTASEDPAQSAAAAFPEDPSLVAAILSMANALGLRVVAEGVNTLEQLDALKALGCHEYQGSFFCDPLRASELMTRLESAL